MAWKDKAEEAKYKKQYEQNNYDRLAVLVPKGDKERIKQAATAAGQSVNAWIGEAINAKLER